MQSTKARNERLRTARKALNEGKGRSMEWVARAAGISYFTYRQVECDGHSPTLATAKAICRVLGKSLSELFDDEAA